MAGGLDAPLGLGALVEAPRVGMGPPLDALVALDALNALDALLALKALLALLALLCSVKTDAVLVSRLVGNIRLISFIDQNPSVRNIKERQEAELKLLANEQVQPSFRERQHNVRTRPV